MHAAILFLFFVEDGAADSDDIITIVVREMDVGRQLGIRFVCSIMKVVTPLSLPPPFSPSLRLSHSLPPSPLSLSLSLTPSPSLSLSLFPSPSLSIFLSLSFSLFPSLPPSLSFFITVASVQ